MSEISELTIDRRDGLAVIYPESYINHQAGEEIVEAARQLITENYKVLLINLAGTEIINSIGLSLLIEVVERMNEIEGRSAFCSLTPTIAKTFEIMGFSQYTQIFSDEAAAIAGLK